MTHIDNEMIECANILLQLKYGKNYFERCKNKTHSMILRPRINK